MSDELREECQVRGKEILEIALGAIEKFQDTSDHLVQEAVQSFVACIAGLLSAESYFLSGEDRPALARIYNTALWRRREFFLDEALLTFAKIAIPAPAAFDLLFRIMENCHLELEESRTTGFSFPQREELLSQCEEEARGMGKYTSAVEMADFGRREHVEAILEEWSRHPTLGVLARKIRKEWTRDDIEEEG